MKIKTIRIKIEDDIQEFNVTDFDITNATLYDKIAHVVQEADGLYWHVMLFYQPNSNISGIQNLQKVDIIRREVAAYIDQSKPPMRIRNGILSSIVRYEEIKTREDFRRIKQIGYGSINLSPEVFDEVLKIYDKYREP
jgi:hypothetical protein